MCWPVAYSAYGAGAGSSPRLPGRPMRPVVSAAGGPAPRGPRCRASTIRDRSSIGSRKVPVQVPPCQMLNTATPVSEDQLRRMLRELPRPSKKTSPRRGSGAASDADMEFMVGAAPGFVQVVAGVGPARRNTADRDERFTDPGCARGNSGGMIDAWLVPCRRDTAPFAAVDRAAGATGIVTFAPAVRTNLVSPGNAVRFRVHCALLGGSTDGNITAIVRVAWEDGRAPTCCTSRPRDTSLT